MLDASKCRRTWQIINTEIWQSYSKLKVWKLIDPLFPYTILLIGTVSENKSTRYAVSKVWHLEQNGISHGIIEHPELEGNYKDQNSKVQRIV